MLQRIVRWGLPALALAAAVPAIAGHEAVSIVPGACVSVANPAGCLFNGNVLGHNTIDIQNTYNLYNDTVFTAQPDIRLEFLFNTEDVPWPGTIEFDDASQTSGTWSLPGYLVSFLAVKASDHFVLYQLPSPVSSGTWNTFGIPSNDGPFALSHLVFFGGGTVPEPATWAMLIAGFGLVGAVARRRAMNSPTVLS